MLTAFTGAMLNTTNANETSNKLVAIFLVDVPWSLAKFYNEEFANRLPSLYDAYNVVHHIFPPISLMIVFLSLNFFHGNVHPFVPWASVFYWP